MIKTFLKYISLAMSIYINSWGQSSVIMAFTCNRRQRGIRVGRTIHQNTQALSFGKNTLKMINILPKLTFPPMDNSGC